MQLESTEPILLNDEQMREYIANGYVILRPSLSEELHRTIDEKFNWIQEHEFNPGNNIVPRLPELELILRSPEVHGALVSVLGTNYLTHPHRCWHFLPSANESLAKEAVAERLAGGCHLDQYTPSSQPRSHRTRYARVMYYPQDTPIELGPTHVVPGSHYHEGLTDEDRRRLLPVQGKAGLVFLSHFDIGHTAGVNLQARSRHMIKFIFMRAEEPRRPSWNCKHSEWRRPENLTAPYALEPAWRDLWNWHCGNRCASPPKSSKSIERRHFQNRLAGEVSTEDKLRVLAAVAGAGPEASNAVPAIVSLLSAGHQALRTSAIYTLAAVGAAAIPALVQALETAGECEAADADPLDFDYVAIPGKVLNPGGAILIHDAAYALAAIGRSAVDSLSGLLNCPYEWTRINAAFALGEMDSTAAAAVPALEKLLNDESHYVIRVATYALGTIRTDAPLASLSQLLNANRPGWDEPKTFGWTIRNAVNVTAAITFARLGKQAAAAEASLIDALQNPCGQVGFLAGEALCRIGTETAIEAVMDDLKLRRWDSSLSVNQGY